MVKYYQEYSWKWLKQYWRNFSLLKKVENAIRTLVMMPVRFVVSNFATVAVLITLAAGVALANCKGLMFDLSYNSVTQQEMEVIAESINCAWSNKLSACFCVYANGGAVGFYAPDKVCDE